MSANQKQTAGGGPQNQRFGGNIYQPITQQPRPDGFSVPTPPFVTQQQPNQHGNQATALRGIQQTGPPNQASTPPTDIKVQQVPQQSMNHLYVNAQPQVRQQFYRQATGPTSQNPRMSNQHRAGQQIYQHQQFIPHMPPLYVNMQYFNGQRPAQYVAQTPLVYQGQVPAQYGFPQSQNQNPAVSFPYFPPMRQGPPQNAAVPPNATQPIQTMQITQPPPPQPQFQRQTKRRSNAIPIIHPHTGVDMLTEIFDQSNSNPPSGESSARQTPQPAVQNSTKEVQAEFAKRVAQAISNDSIEAESQNNVVLHSSNNNSGGGAGVIVAAPSSVEQESPIFHQQPPPPQQQQQQQQQQQLPTHPHQQLPLQQASNRMDPLVQSNLTAHAKEFVSSNTAKETPIVSAMCDSIEVTLPNKQQLKDRESPAKGRKQHQQQQQQHKDSLKDTPIRDNINEKESVSSIANKAEVVNKPKDMGMSMIPQQSIGGGAGGFSSATTIPSSTTQSTNIVPTVSSSSTSNNSNKDNNKEVVSHHHHRDDKLNKNQKKDISKSISIESTKVPHNLNEANNDNNSGVNVMVQAAQSAQDAAMASAKSKNASQRGKDGQKPQQQQQAVSVSGGGAVTGKQAPGVVPPPQPPKANNKTNKKTDLNQKGANKEGTDMDAFNDNRMADAVNANVNNEINANVLNNTGATTSPTNLTQSSTTATSQQISSSSIPSATTIPQTQQQQPPPQSQQNNANDNKKSQNNDGTTIKNESSKPNQPATQAKKVDVTAIVRDTPKSFKTYSQTNIESQDETDRALSLNNDKLVQAKNEANTKACTENNNAKLIDNKTSLPYKEDQWAPDNQDGKKVYDKDFLMAIRNRPQCKQKPDNIPEVIIADDRARLEGGRYSMGGRTDFTTPPFTNYGGKSSSQRGLPPKRNSQTGKVGGGNNKGSKSQVIKVSISVREDVKLHEAENAWKPARFNKSDNMSEDDKKTEELYKKVRGVLNKLTPQKFDTLLSQVRSLEIDTADRLQGVIDLVFEKAVDEPNFSVAYALMCKELTYMHVPGTGANNAEKIDSVNFRKLLITRCQIEFEKQSLDESERNRKLKEIEECTDAERKKELEFDLAEYDRKLRMKSVGNIRFIGELFKQNMLTVSIMLRCLNNLLENKDEESLECLCKLLTTIGKELESKGIDLSPIFNVMKDIVDKKHGKVSSRVRFMLQDVIDLRKGKWVPRRQDVNPKTIEQIQEEAKNEQLNIQAMNALPITPRKDDRGGNNSGGGSSGGGGGGSGLGSNSERNKRRNNTSSDDGWQTQGSRNNRSQFTVHSDKLKNKPPLQDEPLGNKNIFGIWSKGSNIKTDQPPTTNTANMYAALENIDSADKRMQGSRSNKDPYSSKGPSLERGSSSNYKQYDGRGSRSGSQHRSMERTKTPVPQQQPQQQQQQQQQQQKRTQSPPPVISKPAQSVTPREYKLNEIELERRIHNNVEEYLNDIMSVEEYAQDMLESVPPSYFPKMVADECLHALEQSSKTRLRIGQLFDKLILSGVLSIDDYCNGLEEILSQTEDLVIDIPMIWNYIAEILVHSICDKALPLSRLHKSMELLNKEKFGAKMLAALFKLVVSEQGPNSLNNIWQISGLTFEDFMDKSQVESFIKDNKFEFLVGGATSAGQTQLTFDQIHTKLLEFFNLKTQLDDVDNWITANVGDRTKENRFVRVLATAIFEHSIVRQKLQPELLTSHYRLFHKFITSDPSFELQCLFALQALFHKMEHPQGVLLSICDRLYDDSIISQDSFIAWETNNDPAEQEGKGVALKQLTSFFTQLKENESEDSTSSEE